MFTHGLRSFLPQVSAVSKLRFHQLEVATQPFRHHYRHSQPPVPQKTRTVGSRPLAKDYHRQVIRKLTESTHSTSPEPRLVSPPKKDNHRVNKLSGLSRKRSEPNSRELGSFGVSWCEEWFFPSVGAPECFIEKAAKKLVLTKPVDENLQKKQANSGPVTEKPEAKSTPSDP
ncbi:hypothetical protein CJ030_MR1G005389 [Morella rubra]|uniref:Uncharacterized protein n=1 Tax=Morella rubra TaxID=262757 RepID=A0A6A1WIH9_9ROSI|nr:hypothetical protein CJ030_MR1G005396 [Morella rubra]KAB1225082.1 hypothetical protein CJ030_MR1G005389 [Morella rubra]